MNLILIQFLVFFYSVFSIDINSTGFRDYPYIEGALGVLTYYSAEVHTPSTRQITIWNILLSKDEEDPTQIGNGCPDNSSICAITNMYLNNGEVITTEILSVDETYTRIESNDDEVNLIWENQKWGDSSLNITFTMSCLNVSHLFQFEFPQSSTENADGELHLGWSAQYFCNGTSNDGGENKYVNW